MNYQIEYYQPNNQYIKIEATFKVDGKLTELVFPAWRPGRYELANFTKNVKNFEVKDSNGKRLNFNKIEKNKWQVETGSFKEIKVTYFYYAAELNAGSTFMDDLQLYVNPVNCLVYIESQQNEPCQLSVKVPDTFKIASGIPFENNTLHTDSYHQLVDCPFIASANLQYNSYKINNIVFNIWVQGEAKMDWKKVKVDFMKFTRLQLKDFGHFPVKEYHFIYQILPIKAYHGVEHQNSTVIALGPSYDLMNDLYDDFLGVSSHELYHTWNVKAIRPIEMQPYDYATENYSKLGYVAEGVTTYMGDLYLSASKVKPWKWYKSELENLLKKHFDNSARFNYSVAESSFDTWLDGYVQGAPNRKVSIYNEGALLAFVLDIKIRHNSLNKQSLTDLMRSLYDDFGKTGKGYSEQDYIKLASTFAKEDLSEFFEKYHYGTNAFEAVLAEALFNCGLEMNTYPNLDYSERLLGIKCLLSNGKTMVTHICPSSPTELGGVIIGDEIMAVNGFKVNSDLPKWMAYFEESQIELQVNRMGRIINITCPNTNREYYPIYKIEKVDIPSGLQMRIFKSWCGHKWLE